MSQDSHVLSLPEECLAISLDESYAILPVGKCEKYDLTLTFGRIFQGKVLLACGGSVLEPVSSLESLVRPEENRIRQYCLEPGCTQSL